MSRRTESKDGQPRGRLLSSGVFKKLFGTYTGIILLILAVIMGWYLAQYRQESRMMKERDWSQRAAAWGTWMDQQLMQAESLCAAVNASESCRSVLRTAYVEKTTITSMQLYNMLGELNRIKGSARSVSLQNLMLAFQGDNKAYLPGSVISFTGQCRGLDVSPYLGVSTAGKVLGISGSPIILNKEYLIYGEPYTGFGSQSSMKGIVLVLIEEDQIRTALRDRVSGEAGLLIRRSGQKVFATGDAPEHVLEIASLTDNAVTYEVSLPEAAFETKLLTVSALTPLLMMLLISLGFIFLTYRVARRYAQPIDHIQRMMVPTEAAPEKGENEFENIIQGISGLIGERNGYRERMITITPYARQGVLQAAIRGTGQPRTLVEEQFTELRKSYYMVGVVNAAITRDTPAAERRYRDVQELILSLCREKQTGDLQAVGIPDNLQHTFVIAASDEKDVFENFFYGLYSQLEENVQDQDTILTIGTGHRENDLDRLSAACQEAMDSLGQMLTGGRGAVYFPEDRQEGNPGYYFPKDAQKQMTRLLKERDLEGLNALLDDIYQKNLVGADLPPSEIRQLADELYWTIRKALRNAYDLSTTHVRMEPIRDAATIDEIFGYYRQVFAASLQEAPAQEEEGAEKSLEEEICGYIGEHLYDPELSLNGVADQFGVSTKMVGLICKKRYGQTFLSYVRDQQIRHAAELLKETDLSLEEVSARCGFANILTFRRNFRAVMGVNPSEYRG